jgi:hypothetical protein
MTLLGDFSVYGIMKNSFTPRIFKILYYLKNPSSNTLHLPLFEYSHINSYIISLVAALAFSANNDLLKKKLALTITMSVHSGRKQVIDSSLILTTGKRV